MKDLNEILFQLGETRKDYFNAIAPPLIQSSNFAFDTVDDFKQAITHEHSSLIYSRGNNPSVNILQEKLAALEGTEACLVVGSGAGAMSLAVMSQVKAGDHIVCVRDPYSWTYSLLTSYLPKFGVKHTFIDGQSTEAFETSITPATKVLILESPNSLTFELQDIKAFTTVAKAHGIVTIIDNSYCTPLYQQPASLGADIVIHSMSKYINGHSDVVAGAICTSDEIMQQIFYNEYMTLGPAISPHDAVLMIRGLRTLPVRMERIQNTTRKLLAFFKEHEAFTRVWYPFDPDFDQYDLARKQMSGCTGLITVELDVESPEQMNAFANALRRFKMAVSWGGPESLILPMSVLYGLEGRKDPEVSYRVARISVGLEDADWLIDDLSTARELIRGL